MAELISALRQRLMLCMPHKLYNAIRPFITVQFLIFIFFGMINTFSVTIVATILDFIANHTLDTSGAVFAFITKYRITFIIGYAESIVQSFILNSNITFHQKMTFKRFIKFPLSYIPNFVYQYICVFILTFIGLNHTAAYLIAAVTGTPITFLSVKFALKT